MKSKSLKPLRIGIKSYSEFKEWSIAVAAGRIKPNADEPKIWFESILALAQILSPENQRLLSLIQQHNPQSLTELEQLSQRKKSNLSRTLRTLERFGVVELPLDKGRVVPKVLATEFRVEFGLGR